MTNTTNNEIALLRAIADSDYHDGQNPVGNYVWVSEVCEPFGKSAGGIMASLVGKGLARTSGDDCCITQAGWDALGR